MNNSTILYVGNFILPNKSAAANRVVSNSKVLKLLGYNVILLGVCNDIFSGLRNVINESEIEMLEQSRPNSLLQWFKHLLNIDYLLDLLEVYPNVQNIIFYNLPFITVLIAKFKLRKSKISICYDCTEWTKYTDGATPKKIFKFIDEFFVRKFIDKITDKLIVVSSLMAKEYSSHKKMLVVPPLVDVNSTIWNQPSFSDDGCFEFCYAGIPDGGKEQIDLVVKSYLMLERNAKLRIIGISKEQFIEIYPEFSCVNLPDSIIFMGELSHFDTIKYILKSSCFVFFRQPDLRNNAGFPTKFVEGLTSGTAMITNFVSDLSLYSHYETVNLVDCSDIENINKIMNNIIENPPLNKGLCNVFHYERYIDLFKQIF